jgi:hypothetical protein
VSDPIDIKTLDEYLKGGSDISQRYRELGREDVPPELDRRVLGEARAAAASGAGRSRSWLRWGAPLALAASVMLAVTVVIESGPQNDSSFATEPAAVEEVRLQAQQSAEEAKLQDQVAQQPPQDRQSQFAAEPPVVTVQQTVPAAAPAAPPPAASAKTESERLNRLAHEEVPEELRADAKALREQSAGNSPVAPVAADTGTRALPAPQAAAESPAFAGSVATVSARKEVERAAAEADSSDDEPSSVSSTGTRARRAGRTAGPRGTISGSALSSETRPAADEDADRSDPQKWLEQIRELRRAGKVVEADREWLEFGKAFPNFPVADDDLARRK